MEFWRSALQAAEAAAEAARDLGKKGLVSAGGSGKLTTSRHEARML